VPCEYARRGNLSVWVKACATPGDLTIRFLYQGGQTDIMAVDVVELEGHGAG
jgi:hypothetical protein